MTTLSTDDLRKLILVISEGINAYKGHLNALDAELGDGDHGTTLNAGFDAAVKAIADASSPAEILQITAKTLMNRMGGSSGALFGTLFLRAGMTVKDAETLSTDQFAAMWQAGAEGVMQRGKARPGDKTMVDALLPAVEVLKQAADNGETLQMMLEYAADAAEQGAKSTAEMQAKYGRAKYVGERAIGHIDAGAQSIAVMFAAVNGYWKGKENGET